MRTSTVIAVTAVSLVGLTALWHLSPAPSEAPAAGESPRTDASRPVTVRTMAIADSASRSAYAPGLLQITAAEVEPALALGLTLVREAGPAGVAIVRVPPGASEADTLTTLRQAGVGAARVGTIQGAAKGGKTATTTTTTTTSTSTKLEAWSTTDVAVSSYCDNVDAGVRADERQWHLDHIEAPSALGGVSAVVVAVLDSGVAYEDHSDDRGDYVQAPSLASVAFVHPYDFVNDDAHANDDHQHGTHVTSLIASQGDVEGVAKGVTIMPVKILDQDNTGTEVALLDGIAWAVDNGADVINLSVSFDPSYVPSLQLQSALADARDAGVLLVGAAGNNGGDAVTWPAAHPRVIAVGATSASSRKSIDEHLVGYSNQSSRIDLLAPGGDLTADDNGDDLPDGIIGESIALNDPSDVGLWMMAGTSQAAALVTGAVALSLSVGTEPNQVLSTLQQQMRADGDYADGTGAGLLDVIGALDVACWDTGSYDADPVTVAMLPSPVESDDGIAPSAQVTVLDAAGEAVWGAMVYATLAGSSTELLTCETDWLGMCTVTGAAVAGSAQAWSIELETVVEWEGIAHHPTEAIFVTDELELFLAALDADGTLDDALLAWEWTSSDGEVLAWSATNAGSGLVTAPLGIIFTRDALRAESKSAKMQLDLDGSGLVTAPLGFMDYRLIKLGGSGLVTAPLGFSSRTLIAISGISLSGSSMVFDAETVHTADTSDASLLGLSTGDPLWLDDATSTASLSGSSVEAFMNDGAWTDEDGYGLSHFLVGSGSVELASDTSADTSGTGTQALE